MFGLLLFLGKSCPIWEILAHLKTFNMVLNETMRIWDKVAPSLNPKKSKLYYKI